MTFSETANTLYYKNVLPDHQWDIISDDGGFPSDVGIDGNLTSISEQGL
jgi:hypothetical protein